MLAYTNLVTYSKSFTLEVVQKIITTCRTDLQKKQVRGHWPLQGARARMHCLLSSALPLGWTDTSSSLAPRHGPRAAARAWTHLQLPCAC